MAQIELVSACSKRKDQFPASILVNPSIDINMNMNAAPVAAPAGSNTTNRMTDRPRNCVDAREEVLDTIISHSLAKCRELTNKNNATTCICCARARDFALAARDFIGGPVIPGGPVITFWDASDQDLQPANPGDKDLATFRKFVKSASELKVQLEWIQQAGYRVKDMPPEHLRLSFSKFAGKTRAFLLMQGKHDRNTGASNGQFYFHEFMHPLYHVVMQNKDELMNQMKGAKEHAQAKRDQGQPNKKKSKKNPTPKTYSWEQVPDRNNLDNFGLMHPHCYWGGAILFGRMNEGNHEKDPFVKLHKQCFQKPVDHSNEAKQGNLEGKPEATSFYNNRYKVMTFHSDALILCMEERFLNTDGGEDCGLMVRSAVSNITHVSAQVMLRSLQYHEKTPFKSPSAGWRLYKQLAPVNRVMQRLANHNDRLILIADTHIKYDKLFAEGDARALTTPKEGVVMLPYQNEAAFEFLNLTHDCGLVVFPAEGEAALRGVMSKWIFETVERPVALYIDELDKHHNDDNVEEPDPVRTKTGFPIRLHYCADGRFEHGIRHLRLIAMRGCTHDNGPHNMFCRMDWPRPNGGFDTEGAGWMQDEAPIRKLVDDAKEQAAATWKCEDGETPPTVDELGFRIDVEFKQTGYSLTDCRDTVEEAKHTLFTKAQLQKLQKRGMQSREIIQPVGENNCYTVVRVFENETDKKGSYILIRPVNRLLLPATMMKAGNMTMSPDGSPVIHLIVTMWKKTQRGEAPALIRGRRQYHCGEDDDGNHITSVPTVPWEAKEWGVEDYHSPVTTDLADMFY